MKSQVKTETGKQCCFLVFPQKETNGKNFKKGLCKEYISIKLNLCVITFKSNEKYLKLEIRKSNSKKPFVIFIKPREMKGKMKTKELQRHGHFLEIVIY